MTLIDITLHKINTHCMGERCRGGRCPSRGAYLEKRVHLEHNECMERSERGVDGIVVTWSVHRKTEIDSQIWLLCQSGPIFTWFPKVC